MNKSLQVLVIVLLFLVVSACSSATPTPEPTPSLVPITIQLSWIHEYSSSPFHAAVRNGHFAAQGLDATLAQGGFGEQGYIDPIAEVLNGNADFAMSDGVSLIQARAAGQPVVAIAAILQRSPLAVISLADSGIARPQDVAGKTISVAGGGATTIFNVLLQSQNIAPDSLNIVERTTFGIDPLVNGEVDGMVAWIINEGVALQERGLEPVYVLMNDYGVDTYDFVLFTTETMISEHPDRARGVVTALQRGISAVIADPAAAIEHTLTYNGDLVREEQVRRLEATIPLMNVPGNAHGGMDERVWQFTYDTLLEQGVITEPITLGDVYTLDFIPDEDN